MTKSPVWYWIAAVVGLLWMAIGCFAYYTEVSMDAAALAALPDHSRIIISQRPAWATAGFAIGTFGGLIGMVALLARRKLAVPLLAIALLATLISYVWPFALSGQTGSFTAVDWTMSIAILVIQAALFWLARHASGKQWLG